MLELSNQAEEAIRGILASDGVPEGATIRISAQRRGGADSDAGTALAVSIVEEVSSEDHVVEGDDVEVRLEPAAVEMLEDKQLDATLANGQVQFILSAQVG
jgi:Fe-S cluster assembly iron-binding protein IscA